MAAVIGIVIGTIIGLCVSAACVVAKESDEDMERRRYESEKNPRL